MFKYMRFVQNRESNDKSVHPTVKVTAILTAFVLSLALSSVLLMPFTMLHAHAQEAEAELYQAIITDIGAEDNRETDDTDQMTVVSESEEVDIEEADPEGTGVSVKNKQTKQVADALSFIYRDQADVLVSDFSSAASRIRQTCYQELLNGAYSENAVAVFLDHGYFSDKYQDIARSGLLPKDYKLPERPYSITRTNELMRIPQKGDTSKRYVIVTDSPYLQTYQLEEIAAYHDFDELEMYCEELKSYEDTYLPKAQWVTSADIRQ